MNITPVIEAVVALIAAILTYILVPWVKSQQTAQQTAELLKWVEIAVMAAEQLFDSTQGEEKKRAVLAFLKEKGFRFNEGEIDSAVEAAVLKLHRQLEGT